MFENLRRGEIPFTFLSVYVYLLVIGGISFNGRRGEGTGRGFLLSSRVKLCDSDSGFCMVKILGSVGRPVWKTAASSPRGGKQTTGVCTDKKLFWLGDFKFSFGDRTPAYRAPVLMALLRYIVRNDVGNRRVGEKLAASC
jgi:hypothetical protein